MRSCRGHSGATVLVVVSALAWCFLVGCSNSGQPNVPVSANQASATKSPAQPTVAGQVLRSQAVLDEAVKPGEPGCSAAVGRRGKILWTGVAGVSNVQRGDPITADTVFDVGSVSKQFTATAVLLLQQEGKLSVDDRLSRYLAGLPAWADRVTLAHLMHHVSGIPETEEILIDKGYRPQDRVKRATLRKAIDDIQGLDFQPGQRWAYNNPNYFLLAEVVERRSRQPLDAYLNTRIFIPLQLKMSVGYESPVAGKATSYKYNNLNEPVGADWRWDALGSGGLQTTPSQLVLWADNYRSGKVGGTALQQAQLSGAVSTTLGESNPSDSEVYGAGIFKLTDNARPRRHLRRIPYLAGNLARPRYGFGRCLQPVRHQHRGCGRKPANCLGVTAAAGSRRRATLCQVPVRVRRRYYEQAGTGSCDVSRSVDPHADRHEETCAAQGSSLRPGVMPNGAPTGAYCGAGNVES